MTVPWAPPKFGSVRGLIGTPIVAYTSPTVGAVSIGPVIAMRNVSVSDPLLSVTW